MFAADRARGRSPRHRAGWRALALAALALSACTDGSSSDDDQQLGTSVTIDPLAFLGDVQCAKGAMGSYVATLTDESAEGGPSALASSPPISCAWRVSFTSVVEGHEYTVRIDGYGEPAEKLTPEGGETSGNPVMLGSNGQPTDPSWTWECPSPPDGSGSGGSGGGSGGSGSDGAGTIVAEEGVEIVVRACAPLTVPET